MTANAVKTDDLLRMLVEEVSQLSVEELAILSEDLNKEKTELKRKCDNFHAAVSLKYADRFRALRQGLRKDFGKAVICDDEYYVAETTKKNVKWNQHLLLDLWGALITEGAEPRLYIDVEMSVREDRYQAWPDYTRNRFAPARTVKPSKAEFVFAKGQNP